jgi:hypothetical protein
MKLRHLILVLLAGTILGCRTGPREQDTWVYFGHDLPTYTNFYEQLDEYPDYAIAEYTIDEPYDVRSDLRHLRESLRLCRTTFGKAFKTRKLQRFNSEDGYDQQTFETKPGYHAFLPFDPRFVLIAIQNRAEHKGASTFASSYKVAFIVPAEIVFSRSYDFEKVSRAAYVNRDPFRLDPPSAEEKKKGQYFVGHYRWVAIEMHEQLQAGRGGSAEPGGAANGNQPIRSATNSTSGPAGSHR